MARKQRIWITRAQPGADGTAERVRARGHEAVVAPLLEVRPIAGAGVDLGDVAALAFTSANGVRAFAALTPARDLKVFAVGQATALAARQVGFRTVLTTDGDVSALASGIASRARELKGAVLHAGGVDLAGDLTGELEARKIEARRATLYETAPADPGDLATLTACDAVLLHSPKASRLLAGLLADHPAPGLRALGLSAAVLQPLDGIALAGRASPLAPLEVALLNLIDRAG